MKVFVIIVTYNAAKWIDKCFGSLKASGPLLNIIVVDNHSADQTVSVLRSSYPEVELYELKENFGFGKANNIGIEKALGQNADYIFLLNQDAWLQPGAIEGLLALHQKNQEFGILCPIHLNGAGTALDYRFSLTCNEEHCPGLVSDLYLKNTRDIYAISFANAAFWLMSKECIAKAGIFDPIFPHYGEDTDYVKRMRYHGLKIGICPAFYGHHDRENRAPSQKRDRVIRQVGYLCDLKDINTSFSYSLVRFMVAFAIATFKQMIKGNIAAALQDVKFFIRIIISLPQIVTTRKICKKPAAYLN